MTRDRIEVPIVLRIPVSWDIWVWLREKGAIDPFGPYSAEQMALRVILDAIDCDRLPGPPDEDDDGIPF